MRHMGIILLLMGLGLSGCVRDEVRFNEVKRPHETLKTSELNTYLRIVNSLPKRELPPLPSLFAPLPDWAPQRELSVKGLVKEEQNSQKNRWRSDALLSRLASQRALKKALESHDMTLPQFLGLTESINLAAARTHFEDVAELRMMLRNGQYEINELVRREEVFSTQSMEEQHDILRRAAWITRVNRAQDLLRVPDENVHLLRKHWEAISPYLHPDALRDPLADLVDHLKQYGVPFDETGTVGSDAQLRWSPSDPSARIGHATEKQIASQKGSHK